MIKDRKNMIVNNTIIGAIVFNTNEDISKIKRAFINKIESPSLMELSNSIETISGHNLIPVPMRHYKTKLCSLDYSGGKVSIKIKPTVEPGITYNVVVLYTYDAGCYVKTYKMLGIYNMPNRIKLTEKGTMTLPVKVSANTKPRFRDMELEGWCNAWAFTTKEDFKSWYSYEDNRYQLYGKDVIYVTEDYGDNKKEYSSLWTIEDEKEAKRLKNLDELHVTPLYKQLNKIKKDKILLDEKEVYLKTVLSSEDRLGDLAERLKEAKIAALAARELYETEGEVIKREIARNECYIEKLRKRKIDLSRKEPIFNEDEIFATEVSDYTKMSKVREGDINLIIIASSEVKDIVKKAWRISNKETIDEEIENVCALNDKLVHRFNKMHFDDIDKSYDVRILAEFISDIKKPINVVNNIKRLKESVSREHEVLEELYKFFPEMDYINSKGTCSILEG